MRYFICKWKDALGRRYTVLYKFSGDGGYYLDSSNRWVSSLHQSQEFLNLASSYWTRTEVTESEALEFEAIQKLQKL